MITVNALPKGYVPYKSLTICSNTLLGGGHLLTIGKVLPLVVGAGEYPMVWLQAPKDKSGSEFVLLVSSSVAMHPAIKTVNENGTLSVYLGGNCILKVIQSGLESAVIDYIDFRQLGFNISGNGSVLSAGGAELSFNTLDGFGSLLSFANN